MRRLAVVLARGGSKRLPGKNIRPLGGKPLIAWIIEAARSAGCFERVLVSTDDDAIAAAATAAGAWVPFRRPADLSSDAASSVDAFLHAVEWVCHASPEKGGFIPEVCALLQPTTPFTRPEQIRGAVETLEHGGFATLGALCPVHERPEWLFRVDPDGRAVPREPALVDAPSNRLPAWYRETGSLYLARTAWLRERRSLYNFDNHGAFLMPVADAIDIDTAEDWERAEARLRRRAG